MSFVTNGAYKGARLFTRTLFRQQELFDSLKLKSGHAVKDILTDSYSSLKKQEIVTTRLGLLKLRFKAFFKAIGSIPNGAYEGLKNLLSRNKTKAQATVAQ